LALPKPEIYRASLMPGRELRIFGSGGILAQQLVYRINRSNWENRNNYSVQWVLFIDGKVSGEGKVPFNSLQQF
jgi:hypothetical protein